MSSDQNWEILKYEQMDWWMGEEYQLHSSCWISRVCYFDGGHLETSTQWNGSSLVCSGFAQLPVKVYSGVSGRQVSNDHCSHFLTMSLLMLCNGNTAPADTWERLFSRIRTTVLVLRMMDYEILCIPSQWCRKQLKWSLAGNRKSE